MKSSKETLFEELDLVYFTRLMEDVDLMAELYNMKKTNSPLDGLKALLKLAEKQ